MNLMKNHQSNFTVIQNGSDIEVSGITSFFPKHIFECGQCFRWIKEEEGIYTGVAHGKVIRVSMKNKNSILIENSSPEDFYNIWYDYFDLGTNYDEIKKLVAKDDIMKKAIEFGWGIRLLRQDFSETLISFIISSNNRIPRIMKSVDALARLCGEPIFFNGKEYFSFPSIDALAKLSKEEIDICKAGFRCRYIYNTVRHIKEQYGERGDYVFSKEDLLKLQGVGQKVADCVLLFSGIRYDVFPTDVWVKRVMEELYFGREASIKEIDNFAKEYFGPLAGYAQQYLFYYARENKIGIEK